MAKPKYGTGSKTTGGKSSLSMGQRTNSALGSMYDYMGDTNYGSRMLSVNAQDVQMDINDDIFKKGDKATYDNSSSIIRKAFDSGKINKKDAGALGVYIANIKYGK